MKAVKHAYGAAGWEVRCISKPVEGDDGVYWPAREVAILVEVTDVETQWNRYVEDSLRIGKRYIGDRWPYRIAAVINGHVVAALAFVSWSRGALPDSSFVQEWSQHIDEPFLLTAAIDHFDSAMSACVALSGILACRDTDALLPEEEEVVLKAADNFNRHRDAMVALAHRAGTEYLELAVDYIEHTAKEVLNEHEAQQAGVSVDAPVWMIAHEARNEKGDFRVAELAAIRMNILQGVCIEKR